MKKSYRMNVAMVMMALCVSLGTAQAQEKPYARGTKSWQKVEGPFFETCSMCHQRLGERLAEQVTEWRNSVHFRNGVFCDSCHGGNPMSTVLPIAMGEAYGFRSDPSPQATPDFCGPSCHQEAFVINEANIHTEDFEDNEWEPNCVTCHGSHEVQEVNTDLITLEEKTCGPCHSRTFYLRQTMKDELVVSNQIAEDLYIQLNTMPAGPYKENMRLRLDKAFKDLRSLAHYFNRKNIEKAKAPIDAELTYIKGMLLFNQAATLRQPSD